MNAVIVDIQKKHAAALDESGRVVRIPNANYEIGQKIELHEVKPKRTPTMLKRFSTGVAAALLIAMLGTGSAYAMPYGTVTLDGDTSIEYTINCFDYVLAVKGTNEEGEALLAEMDTRQLRHHRIDTALGATVEHMEQQEKPESEDTGLRLQLDTPGTGHAQRLQQELAPLIEREAPNPPTEDRIPQPEEPDKEKAMSVSGQEGSSVPIPNGEQNAAAPQRPEEDPLQEPGAVGEGFAEPGTPSEYPDIHPFGHSNETVSVAAQGRN